MSILQNKAELEGRKEAADQNWERIMQDIALGIVDQEDIAKAMQMCNDAEQALINHDLEVSKS